jgi:hypothetical protein
MWRDLGRHIIRCECLPTVSGLVGAVIWNLTNAGDGGRMRPVPRALMFAGVAAANISLWLMVLRARRRRRPRQGGAPTIGLAT